MAASLVKAMTDADGLPEKDGSLHGEPEWSAALGDPCCGVPGAERLDVTHEAAVAIDLLDGEEVPEEQFAPVLTAERQRRLGEGPLGEERSPGAVSSMLGVSIEPARHCVSIAR